MIITDLHIHSKYSRACSTSLSLDNLEKYARIKGVNLLGTGDFQHPKWSLELNKLKEDEDGILWTENKFPFIWQSEISLMYSQDGRGRRVHFVILAPNREVVKQITEFLGSKGRLDYDGRPIFGFTAIELVDAMNEISSEIEIIPAHCMTPYFGIFGSKSGFDSVEECFKDNTKYIHAVETGMSADPFMLRKVSKFDKLNLVSFSDSHSFWPWRLSREATLVDCELKYKDILKAIRTGSGLKGTIETPPAYGRYHLDGHRNCNLSLEPKDTIKNKGICPICKTPLTIGVEYRIQELADRIEPKLDKEYRNIIPLHELIAAFYNIKQLSSKKVWDVYNEMIKNFGNEFNILLNVSRESLSKIIDEKLVEVIMKNRENKLNIEAGYDGVYGKINLNEKKQKTLTDF